LSDALKAALSSRYRIESEIGSGGMATVYLARDLKHDRKVAVKVLKPEIAATLGAERFLLEIRLAAKLNHPHILPLHDSGRVADVEGGPDFLYYSMPVVEGESLRARLNREGQLGMDAIYGLAKGIGAALDYAHKQGVIHRDIKPENILFHHGVPMIADFGIALAVEEAGGDRLTKTGISVGTPQYMSPEQVSGDRRLDARSDVYALGCVLYETLVGEPPFTGPSAIAVMARQVTDSIRPIETVRPDVPARLVTAVNRALAKAPADRFDSAGHFSMALAIPEPKPTPERVPPPVNPGGPPRRSIAVLPFANRSADPENEYFSDGITDDVMSQLSKVGDLKVISRTSTTRFRDTDLSLREIGEQLNADVILEGTVRRQGSRVRIVAQLIDARDDTHIWNDTYDRMLTDVFEIQSEVAISIAEALEARLSPKERIEIRKKPTDDLQAYDLYLLGRHHCNKRAADDLRRAITYFEQAIERDAGYADAYAGLAEAYVFAGIGYMPMPSAEAFALAKEKALRAIQLDPDRATAHAMLGFTALTCDGDAATAERSLSHALELDSNYVQTYQWLGWCRTCVGDYAGGSEAWELALELDPLSAVITAESGWPFIYTRLYERALERFQRALGLDPDLALAHFCVGWALNHLGRYEEAIQALEKGLLLGGAPFWRAFLASAHIKAGQRDRAEAILNELCEQAEQQGGMGVSVAVVAEALGHRDLALDSLERAYSNRDDMPLYAIQITEFLPLASLRGHPRFEAIVDGLGFSPHDIEGERKRLLERERAMKVVKQG